MKARWLVAKYMPDLRRREPDNVGIILLMDGRAHLRFLGQRDGRVDGHSARWANLFGRLSIHDQVQKDFKLEIDEDTIHFDYRYDNGQMILMQGVSLVNADDRSWDNVHRVAYEFAKSVKSPVSHQAIALVNRRGTFEFRPGLSGP